MRTIEQRFVALRGKGYALSARDLALVLEWRALGLPLRVVMGAVEEGVRRRARDAHGGRPLTLSMFARAVTAAATKWAERGVTLHDVTPAQSPPESPFGLLAAALEHRNTAIGAPVEAVLAAASVRMNEMRLDGREVFEVARTLDQEIADALLNLLGTAERATLRRTVEARIDRKMSEAAQKSELEFRIAKELRAKFGVAELIAVLLDGR